MSNARHKKDIQPFGGLTRADSHCVRRGFLSQCIRIVLVVTAVVAAMGSGIVVRGETPTDTKKPAEPSGYFVIPVDGTIGFHFTDAVLERCLAKAVEVNPQRVVLVIDSPGGLVSELNKITQRMMEWQAKTNIPMVAYVKPQAYSAAAIMALGCKGGIMMAPGSTIGATAVVGDTSWGMVKLKRDSVDAAQDRAVAQFGGHDPLIAKAMSDSKIQLWMLKKEDKVEFIERVNARGSEKAPKPGAKLIKREGTLLTLTFNEAVDVGLAKAIVSDYSQMGEQLGIPEWPDRGDAGQTLAKAQFRAAESAQEEIKRIGDLMQNALNKESGTTMQTMTRHMGELRGARQGVKRIGQLRGQHAYLTALLEEDALERLGSLIDDRMSSLQKKIEAGRPKEKRPIIGK